MRAPANARPILVLPGFGNASQDYLERAAPAEGGGALVPNLQARGFQVAVVPLERKDWFKVARAILTRGFWSSSLTTSPGYTWYLERVEEVVRQLRQETGAEQVRCQAGGAVAARCRG